MMTINTATQQYIFDHINDDVRQLALHPAQDVDMPFALNQIQGWQTAKKKLPTWAETAGIIYPPHLNMEQCSSEKTAKYKQFIIHNFQSIIHDSQSIIHDSEGGKSTTLIDLTGGFGVDFSFMARSFDHAVYVERDERLCELAKHNFEVLGLKNVEVVNGEAQDYLSSLGICNHKPQISNLKPQRLIYLDPARRDTNGHKVYGIEDCTPDVLTLKDELLEKADCVMIKLSPMLDWHEAVRKLGDCVREVHIVSVGNECKELLVVCLPPTGLTPTSLPSTSLPPAPSRRGGAEHTIRLVCVNDEKKFEVNYPLSQGYLYNSSSNGTDSNRSKGIAGSPSTGGGWGEAYLYVPNASIMKAGIFAHLTEVFHVSIVDKNSHLFLSNDDISDFPGRKFRILATTTLNKKELKEKLNGITKANISVRNFPLSVAELRKRLKLKDGGDIYLFATTAKAKHIIYICKACH